MYLGVICSKFRFPRRLLFSFNTHLNFEALCQYVIPNVPKHDQNVNLILALAFRLSKKIFPVIMENRSITIKRYNYLESRTYVLLVLKEIRSLINSSRLVPISDEERKLRQIFILLCGASKSVPKTFWGSAKCENKNMS